MGTRQAVVIWKPSASRQIPQTSWFGGMSQRIPQAQLPCMNIGLTYLSIHVGVRQPCQQERKRRDDHGAIPPLFELYEEGNLYV